MSLAWRDRVSELARRLASDWELPLPAEESVFIVLDNAQVGTGAIECDDRRIDSMTHYSLELFGSVL